MMRIEHLVARLARTAVIVAPTTRVALGRPVGLLLQQQLTAGFATRASTGSRKKPPASSSQSFAIAEAFEGLDDDDSNDDDNGDISDLSDDDDDDEVAPTTDSRTRSRTRRTRDTSDRHSNDGTREFQRAIETKKRWLQSLAAQKQFDHIVKAVDDCYAPLYALPTSKSLASTRALLTKHFDATRVTTKFQPLLFSDALTKATEQEALALLVIARDGARARAVFEHRQALAARVAASSIILPVAVDATALDIVPDAPLDLTNHFRSFYSWGMGAYSLTHDYDAITTLYEAALAADIFPTASMNATHLKALVSLRRPAADVRLFYDAVRRTKRPTNVFFYREMLFFAAVQHDAALMLNLLEAMKRSGFKLRVDDYLNAIKAFDDQYYLVSRAASTSAKPRRHPNSAHAIALASKLTTPLDTYVTCITRMRVQDDNPLAFEDFDAATHSVVALFDEMVDDERVAPTNEQLYPRVIAAAVYARQYAKALTAVDLFYEHCPDAVLPPVAVRMAVNALLLLHEPERAYALVQTTQSQTIETPRAFALIANIVEYLCVSPHTRTDDVIIRNTNPTAQLLAILQDAHDHKWVEMFSNATVKQLLPTLVRASVEDLSDAQLWDVVCKHERVFRVRTKPHAFAQFLNECAFRGRVNAAKRALKQRDARRVGGIKPRLALRLANAFAARGEDDAAIAELLGAIDVSTAAASGKPDELVALCAAIVRANERLGRSRDYSKRAGALLLAPLLQTGQLERQDVPADVAAVIEL